MQITRREFLSYTGLILGGSLLGYPLKSLEASGGGDGYHLIVGTDHKVCSINLNTLEEQSIDLSFKPHICLINKDNPYRFLSIQKWGNKACNVDFSMRSIINTLESPTDTQYTGHGFFTAKGDALYLTTANYISGDGYITGYDTRNYKQISHNKITAGNLHDCSLRPDGSVLIASDGMRFVTKEMSKNTYVPQLEPGAIVQVNLNDLRVTNKYEISDHDQLLSHLAVTKEGNVFGLSAPAGIDNENKGELYFMKANDTKLKNVRLPNELNPVLKGELLSIAIDEAHDIAVITNPLSNTLIFVSSLNGEYIKHMTEASLYSNASYDPLSKRFIVGGEKIAAINTLDYSLDALNISNMHIPRKNVKYPGIYNGSHSIIVASSKRI